MQSLADEIIEANNARNQGIADADYIIEFSDRYEGMVRMWRDALITRGSAPYGALEEMAERATQIQSQRKAK